MVNRQTNDVESKPEPKLKLIDSEVSEDDPWGDDALDRTAMSARLTDLVRNQRVPFTISIDGQWGTGKTFFLTRWQKDLERQGFKAIYFNAWEDDFFGDPLLAIIGQLADYFSEGPFKTAAIKVSKVGIQFIGQNVQSVAKKFIGADLSKPTIQDPKQDLLEDYRSQKATRDELKKGLANLSRQIADETDHPLIFIIDELDRCRPTFAIELLERVKHIFDAPNIVFVFGINRHELCKSLQSIYGDIEADIYLRRFFDIEFRLPEVGAEKFCRHLFEKYELYDFFESMQQFNYINNRREFENISIGLPRIWTHMGLSLRDLDYCVRLVSLAAKNLQEGTSLYPMLLGTLIPLKFANPELYREFMDGQCTGSKVIDFIDDCIILRNAGYGSLDPLLDAIEIALYRSDIRYSNDSTLQSLAQIDILIANTDAELDDPVGLSKRTQRSNVERLRKIKSDIESPDPLTISGEYYIRRETVETIKGLIDFSQSIMRR